VIQCQSRHFTARHAPPRRDGCDVILGREISRLGANRDGALPDEAVAWSTDHFEKREDAKKALHKMIVTALNICSEEAKIDPASYPIVAQAIIDQVTQPHVTWVLKELSNPLRSY
jgi:hypothetical protein